MTISMFKAISNFISGINVDEEAQSVVDEVNEIAQNINESNESNLTEQGSEAPISDMAPLEEIEEMEDDYDTSPPPEDDIPIENPQDNISTNNPEPLACEVKIKDAFFAKKKQKAVPSLELGSYKFPKSYTVNKDNTKGREKVVNDILKYIVKPLGEKYNNKTTKANIDSVIPYKKLGTNVDITFNIYNKDTKETTSHSTKIKNKSKTYDGRKKTPTKSLEVLAKEIVKNVITPKDEKDYMTTLEDVKKLLTKKVYAKDEVLENIKLYQKVDIYTKINKALLGSKVYLVAKTENFRKGESVKFKIFENGDKLLSDYVNENDELPFLLGTNEKTEVTGVVVTDDVDNPETGNIKEGVVAVEIALRPKKDKPDNDADTDANLEDWKKRFKKAKTDTKDKEDKFYLKVSTVSYPDIEEEEFLVGDELLVTSCTVAPWMEIVKGELGKNETNDRTRIEEYVKVAKGGGWLKKSKKDFRSSFNVTTGDGAWCSCFASWSIEETNKQKGTDFSRLTGWESVPEGARNWINMTFPKKEFHPPIKPPYGTILIMKHISETDGHATFITNYERKISWENITIKNKKGKKIIKKVKVDKIEIVALGGNQDDKVQYLTYVFKKNSKGKYMKGKQQIYGYVLPKEYKYDEKQPCYYKYETTKGGTSDKIT